jgi:putative ABC transport system permease protein
MNVVSRGIRNAFRNSIRTLSIVIILGLSVGLSLTMLVAHQAVGDKINSVKSSVGNTVSVSPAGVRGFEGGGNPLTQTQLASVQKLPHVTSVTETLSDRLTSSDTNLQSSITAGSLGKRFAGNSGESFTPPAGAGFGGGASASGGSFNFTPPVTVTGTTAPTDLSSGGATEGGGTFTLKSGQLFSGNSTANVALLGTSLASKNNLKVGSTFSAYSTTITVDGIFDAGNTFSNSQLIMPLATVQKLSSQVGDITNATVNVDSITNVNNVTSAIEKQLGSAADVTNAAQQAQQTVAPLQNIQSISLYSLIGAVIAGAIIILLTMVMIVRERRREIGVIKAIGGSNIKVMAQFMVEAVTFTALAAVVGILLGVLAGNPITRLLVNNSSSTTSGATGAARFGGGGGGAGGRSFGFVRNNFSTIHAAVGWDIIIYGFGAALIIAIAGSALSSFFIAKIRPAEVMRVE